MPHCNFWRSCPSACGSALFGSHSMSRAAPLYGEFAQYDAHLGH